ncbi:NF-kappa-B essential modulator-like [Anabas testudineus]|uniref:NF-kappa-B essential modulator-like n=1 Tax=Anabas testudineus TaxID=64144 RepID=UPI000E462715|nr:NF-kappa-B essential modulator-like [Anabas testudineus]
MSERCEEMEGLGDRKKTSSDFQRLRAIVEKMFQERFPPKSLPGDLQETTKKRSKLVGAKVEMEGLGGRKKTSSDFQMARARVEKMFQERLTPKSLPGDLRDRTKKKSKLVGAEVETEGLGGRRKTSSNFQRVRARVEKMLTQGLHTNGQASSSHHRQPGDLRDITEGGDLCSRLQVAEQALALKQDLIDQLRNELELQKRSMETVPVLTAQAEIYKADFLAEREAREKLNQEKEELQDQLTQAMTEIERLKQEATSRGQMEQMKQRHPKDFLKWDPHRTEELPDFWCPKCQHQTPDMDTLQIHIMDCVQ